MHSRSLVVAAALLASPLAMAQSASTLVPPSATVAPSAPVNQGQDNSYMIAPGVAVTSFYAGAPTQVSSYDPSATQTTYSSQAYQGAAVSSDVYAGNVGAVMMPATQTNAYQANYAVPVAQGATPYDNTPYRFYMQQDGKQMSAADFEAWMKARGIRIAGGNR